MKFNKLFKRLTLLILLAGLGCAGWYSYKKYFTPPPVELFTTQKAERRDIKKVVLAEGSLEAQGTSRIGSLINAKVIEIFVKEGDKVTHKTLLATLENDKGGDAEVRRTKAALEKANITYDYLKKNYGREKKLFEAGQRSADTFEKITRDYLLAQKTIIEAQGSYDKELFLFEQTKVCAPHDGIIVSIQTKVGQAFSPFTSPPQVLFEIAESLDTMKATLFIDENKMSDIKTGMKARIKVDAFPLKAAWKGKIEGISISNSQQKKPGSKEQSSVMYEATVMLDNHTGHLRPGMSVNAEITIKKSKQALAIPGFVFQLNPQVLEQAAKLKSYEFKPLDPAEKKKLLKQKGTHPVKTVWTFKNQTITEKAITLGITDNAYFEILSGLDEQDDIIADDMAASEELKRFAQAVAGG